MSGLETIAPVGAGLSRTSARCAQMRGDWRVASGDACAPDDRAPQREPRPNPPGSADDTFGRWVASSPPEARATGREHVARTPGGDLDCLAHAAFVCDRAGKLLAANDTAKGLLEELVGRDRRIRFALSRDNHAFAALLAAALDPGRAGEMPAMACELAAVSGEVVLRALRLSRGAESPVRQEVLVLVETLRGPAEALRRDYGLTATEARVALALAEGIGLDEICLKQGVARTTIRSHLKSIYAKTESRGQVQLVVLVSKLWRCG